MHGRIIKRRDGSEWVGVVAFKRHAHRKTQCPVVAGRQAANQVRRCCGRATAAGGLAVFEVDQGEVRLLPGDIGMKLKLDGVSVCIDQLYRGHIKAQVTEPDITAPTGNALAAPARLEGYFDAKIGFGTAR